MSTPDKVQSPKKNLSQTSVHYAITADATPNALPSVLGIFSARNIAPEKVSVRRYNQASFHDNNMDINIHVSGLSASEQEAIFRQLSAHAVVHDVYEEILFQKLSSKLAS